MAKSTSGRKQPVAQNMRDDDEDDAAAVAAPPKAGPKPASKPKSAAERAADDEDDDAPPAPKKPKKKEESVIEIAGARGIRRASFDDLASRKLTKKAAAGLKDWRSAEKRGKLLDTFLARQSEEARRQFGHKSVYLGSQTENLVICIPCPSLGFEYLITQNGFPLGLIMQIVAKHGVGKSGLLAEIGRWFDRVGGGMVLCENETKFNSFWYESMMGMEAYNRVQLHRCKSVEDWQRHLTWSIETMQRDMMGTKDDPGPGRIVPVLYGVDSIMGKMSEENQEKILGTSAVHGDRKRDTKKKNVTGSGYANARSFPIEAGSITKYLRSIPQILDGWPFALVLINHLRIKTTEDGLTERNKTGGEQVNFQESFELEVKKIGGPKSKIQCTDYEGISLEITCEKNSFGPTGRKIRTRLLWWHEPDPENPGESVQKTVWDWDWTTVHTLNAVLKGESGTYLKTRLKDTGFHLDCPSVGDVDNKAWSKTLGMSDKDDALPWTEVGALIREDEALMMKLRDALCISPRPHMEGDYMRQMAAEAEKMP